MPDAPRPGKTYRRPLPVVRHPEAVANALTDLGFRVENPEQRNRADRVAWDGERAVVLEIKGREKGVRAALLGHCH